MSSSSFKACEGGEMVKLAPMRMADAVKQEKPTTPPIAKTSGYTPPHLRKTGADTPKTVASIDTSSAVDFPTLGSAPRSSGGSASWTQIRSRFQAPAVAPETPAATPATAATNQFAALDEDSTVAAKTPGAINFKQVIKDRIKREDAERRGMQQEEPTDPQLMTREQLERKGWAVLSMPSTADAQARAAWFAEYVARVMLKESKRDREFEALCEIYAPAGTVEPELRKQRLAVDPEVESVGYESEHEEEHVHEIEAY